MTTSIRSSISAPKRCLARTFAVLAIALLLSCGATVLSGCDFLSDESDDVEYVDGFEVARFEKFNQEDCEGALVYLSGTIARVQDYDTLYVEDESGNEWMVAPSSVYDLTGYKGSKCEVYGYTEGIPSGGTLPVIKLRESPDARIEFEDGNELTSTRADDFPLNPDEEKRIAEEKAKKAAEEKSRQEEQAKREAAESSSSESASSETESERVTVPTEEETEGDLVWVPRDGGTKYHSKSGCSGMKNPIQVSRETAQANGFEPCKRCM